MITMKRLYREIDNEATKDKMSAKKQGSNNPMYGKKHTEDSKKLISDKLKDYWSQIPSKNETK